MLKHMQLNESYIKVLRDFIEKYNKMIALTVECIA